MTAPIVWLHVDCFACMVIANLSSIPLFRVCPDQLCYCLFVTTPSSTTTVSGCSNSL
jgi:hypothetical protein